MYSEDNDLEKNSTIAAHIKAIKMNVARSRVIYSGQLCRNKVFSVAQIVDLDALTDGRETGAAK